MKWKYLFSRNVLNRGENYYRSNRVENLKKNNDSQYTARVRGSDEYNVSVTVVNNEITSLECDCPHAESGNYCKHMAALLFAINEYSPNKQLLNLSYKKQTSRNIVYPFEKKLEESDAEKYHYFDFERITKNIVVYDDTYREAMKILQDNGIEDFQIQFGYGADELKYTTMVGEARGYFKIKNNFAPLVIVFNKNEILQIQCRVPFCQCYYSGYKIKSRQKELCAHIIAMLLMIQEYVNKNEVGDSTDITAMYLLKAFRAARAVNTEAQAFSGRQISIEPRITRSYGRLYLSFRIGCDKLYVVRNLTDLVNCIENKETIHFGKLTLNFAQDVIEAQDIGLYKLIKDTVIDQIHRNQQTAGNFSYYSREENVKSDIELYGQRLDNFFDIAKETGISYTEKDEYPSVSKTIRLGKKSPKISLEIKKDVDENGVFHGIIVEGTAPKIIEGSNYNYFLDDDSLNRIDEDSESSLKPLYSLIKNGKISFQIGRQNLSEFYYTVLPQLQSCINIYQHDTEEIEACLPPEVKFIFYLDMANGIPVCRAMAQYGEIICSTMDCLFTDKIKESFRDTYREAEAIATVQKYFPQADAEDNQFCCDNDEDLIYSILDSGISELLKLGEVQCTDNFKALRIRSKVQIKVGVSVSGDLMNLEISSTDVSQKELFEILQSYKLKKRYHRLKSGDFLNIDDSISELSSMVDTMHLTAGEFISGKIKIPTYRALYLDNMSEQCDALHIKRDRYFKKIIQGFKTVSESDFEVPESLQGIMRNYQVYGHKWLRTLETYGFGGILADDMGLGKTLQMISVFLAAKADGQTGTSIVICPSSLVYNWIEELSRFAPELSTIAVAGAQKGRIEIINNCSKYDVIVTSYDLLKRDVAAYEKVSFLYQVLDEAQYIKTHTTAASKSVKIIQIENRLSELWSIFDYLTPGFLYKYETFKKEIETPIVKKNDANAIERLKRMTSPFILRRLKSDVLKDLPEKIEEVRYTRFSQQQQLIYDSQVLRMKDMLNSQNDDDVRKNKLKILAELTKIRQICCDPSLLFQDYHGESAKRTACMDLIKSAMEGEHRILLFSQFTSMLELLEQDLKDADISYYKITGSTSKKERIELVQKFNTDKTPVFLISLKAGGTGLNLTGADMVIHYDPWWNIAAQNQATDRAHRIGQTKVVSVYKLIVKNSIEEKILQMQKLKKNLADEILTGELGNIGSLSKEELLQLID